MLTEIDGNEIYYEIHGEENAPQDILILHGWGCNTTVYRLLVSWLCDRYRVIIPDFPGFGKSSLPKTGWDVQDFADFTMKFSDIIGLKNPILIGHSNGGRSIIRLCSSGVMMPSKIVMIDACGVKPTPTRKQKFRSTSFKAIKRVLTLPGVNAVSGGLLQAARKFYGSDDYNNAPEVLRQTLIKLVNSDQTDELSAVKASALLIYGENDTATPVYTAKVMEDKMADAGLCIIKNAGHFSFADQPAQVCAILKSFLP